MADHRQACADWLQGWPTCLLCSLALVQQQPPIHARLDAQSATQLYEGLCAGTQALTPLEARLRDPILRIMEPPLQGHRMAPL